MKNKLAIATMKTSQTLHLNHPDKGTDLNPVALTVRPRAKTKAQLKAEQKLVFQAAEEGRLDSLPRELFNPNTLMREHGFHHRTPLHVAASKGSLKQVPAEFLTEMFLTVGDWQGDTPIHFAAEAGHWDQLPPSMLTEKYLGLKGAGGRTPVHEAVQAGNLHQIAGQLTRKLMTQGDDRGDTPLHFAACWGGLKKIPKKFLTAPNLLVQNNRGENVMHYAAERCFERTPKNLLMRKLILVPRDFESNTPFLIGVAHGGRRRLPAAFITEKNYLMQNQRGENAIHRSAAMGNLDKVPRVFLTQANLLTATSEGKIPLHLAAECCRLGRVPMFALAREYLVCKDNQGDTPLHLGVYRRSNIDDIPKSILTEEYLTVQNNSGFTPLHWLAEKGLLATVPADILTGKNLTIPARRGVTPLHLAASRTNLHLIPATALTDDNLHLADAAGKTPLARTITSMLSRKHAFFPAGIVSEKSLTFQGKSGRTLLHFAAMGGLNRVAPEILTAKNLTIKDADGMTPLHIAAESGQLVNVPETVLTFSNLAIKDKYGSTVYDCADCSELPQKVLKEIALHEHDFKYIQQVVPHLTDPEILKIVYARLGKCKTAEIKKAVEDALLKNKHTPELVNTVIRI